MRYTPDMENYLIRCMQKRKKLNVINIFYKIISLNSCRVCLKYGHFINEKIKMKKVIYLVNGE
jgi:hypothetical protein